MNWSGALRDSLRKSHVAWADAQGIAYYGSRGQAPTILFETAPDKSSHGNFHPESWRTIRAWPQWSARLDKVHSQRSALPNEKASGAMELDSSNSSDALLMNCFCYPGAAVAVMMEFDLPDPEAVPDFGLKAKLPLLDGSNDATEVDMRIGATLFEAKLTEQDFTSRPLSHVKRYKDLEEYFNVSALVGTGDEVHGYQLVRNVLAAAHHDAGLVVLLDARRPDLMTECWRVHAAVHDTGLRMRCGFRTWQEVAAASPASLADFLGEKYGL